MLIAKRNAIFFPGIDNIARLRDECDMTQERYVEICDSHTVNFHTLKAQLEYLKGCCKNELEFYTVLLLAGMDTNIYATGGKMHLEKPILLTDFDNWDRVDNEFNFTQDELQRICDRYAQQTRETDFRQMPLKKQIEILHWCCNNDPHFYVMLANIGMATQNWLYVNTEVNDKLGIE